MKLIIGFLVVIAIGVGLYFFSPRADAPTVDTAETSQEDTKAEGMDTTTEESQSAPAEKTTPAAQTSNPTTAVPKTTSGTQPSSQTSGLPYSATVIYDGGRFIPDDVTIVVGGTVRWVNTNSDVDMWIATNNHPTHNLYPIKTEVGCSPTTFDQCAAVGQGGSWTFRFDRYGGWRYHNEERARDTGIIHVLTVEEYQKQI